MVKKVISVVMLLGLVLTFWACEKQESAPAPQPAKSPEASSTPSAAPAQPAAPPEAAAQPAAGRKLRFAFIPKALHIPVFNFAKIGAERKAKEYGNVEILWNAPQTNDQLKQKEILETYIAMKVDGIAISCLNGDYLTETINKAVDKGIPVITWDSDAPKSKRLAFYGVNDFKCGEVMGEELVKLINGKGQVAFITTLGADNLTQRLDGAKSIIGKYPEISIVDTFDVKDDAILAGQVVATASQKYPDLAAWLSVGGWPGFARNILDPVDPQKTKVVTFDTIPPAPEIMKEGKIQMALGQKYFGWGSEPCRILYDIVVNKKNPESTRIDSGVDVVTSENLDEYLAKWKLMEEGKAVE